MITNACFAGKSYFFNKLQPPPNLRFGGGFSMYSQMVDLQAYHFMSENSV